MFGWELPPYNSGGLGTATLGLTEGLAPLGVDIDLVLPKVHGPFPYSHMNILDAGQYDNVSSVDGQRLLTEIEKNLIASSLGYGNQAGVNERAEFLAKEAVMQHNVSGLPISPNLQATWYAFQAASIAKQRNFDIIHCHDWMTYYCGIAAKKIARGKGMDVPYVAQIHATEHDRCGVNGDPVITAIEREGLRSADRVIAVSEYTKKVVHREYQVPLKDISVVYNGISPEKQPEAYDMHELKKHFKIVIFIGRVTMQKGPDYFIKLAQEVTKRDPKVKFIMVGSGDMEKRCIEEAAATGMTGKILFSSFLRGKDVDRAYQLADLFVMPSVSEPFGIVALEAIQNGTPVIVSKQSGVAEVSNNIAKVDFWDTKEMANKTLHILHNPEYADQLNRGGKEDLKNLTWGHSAKKLKEVYSDVITSFKPTAPHIIS